MLTRAAVVLLLALPLTACGDVQETAGRAADCVQLARAAADAGLSGTPSAAQAEEAVRTLDERVEGIDDPQLREDAGALRDRLREVLEAARSADPATATAAADRARQAARDTARTCGLPVDQFLG